jgi:hypothetical protein
VPLYPLVRLQPRCLFHPLYHIHFLLRLSFYPQYGSRTLLRNVGKDLTATQSHFTKGSDLPPATASCFRYPSSKSVFPRASMRMAHFDWSLQQATGKHVGWISFCFIH